MNVTNRYVVQGNELLQDYAEFIKWDKGLDELWDILYNCSNNALYMEWTQKDMFYKNDDLYNPIVRDLTKEDLFYINNKMYLPELVRWNIEREQVTRRIVNCVKNNKSKFVFDFGCGIGTDIIELFKIGCIGEYSEYNRLTSEFISFRLEKHGLEKHLFGNIPKFDLTICLDVLEHLDNPIEKLNELAKKTTYMAVNFNDNFDVPMHLDSNKKALKEFNKIVGKWKKEDTDIYEVVL